LREAFPSYGTGTTEHGDLATVPEYVTVVKRSAITAIRLIRTPVILERQLSLLLGKSEVSVIEVKPANRVMPAFNSDQTFPPPFDNGGRFPKLKPSYDFCYLRSFDFHDLPKLKRIFSFTSESLGLSEGF
jgi:hypothetical protein